MSIGNKADKSDNPFIKHLYDVKLRSKLVLASKGKNVDILNKQTGEIDTKYFEALATYKHSDSTVFVKLYPDAYDVFKKLSKGATLMLWYFMSRLNYEDTVLFDIDRAKEFTGYSSNKTIYKAITELKNNDIIANHKRNGMYYINPMLFYRGHRMRLINFNRG